MTFIIVLIPHAAYNEISSSYSFALLLAKSKISSFSDLFL